MSIESLILKLKTLKVNVRLDNGQLKVDAPKGALSPQIIEELREKKDELIEFLNKKYKAKDYEEIPKAKEQGYYPLSSAQKSLYFMWQFDKTSTEYNMPQIFELKGDPDFNKIEETFFKLVERHEVLRTKFILEGVEPVQKIEGAVKFSIEHDESTEDEKEQSIRCFIKPFDIEKAPLLRVKLTKLGTASFLLMIDMHHIISDELSHAIIIKEFLALYIGDALPELKIQFKDYVVWQDSASYKKKIKLQEEYWINKMKGDVPVLDLAYDYVRPLIKSYEGKSIGFEISRDKVAHLKAISRKSGSSLFMVLLAAFNIFLNKLSSQNDIIVGTPIAGRKHPDLSPMLGMFVNTLVLRTQIDNGITFLEFLEIMKLETIEAFDNQEYPFGELVGKLTLDRDVGRNPLFDVMFALHNHEIGSASIPGLELSACKSNSNISKFDLTLQGVEQEGELCLYFEYCTKLFKAETIERFIKYFKKIIDQILEKVDQTIFDIEILGEAEKHQLLFEFNDTKSDYPKDKTIHALFEEQAKRIPDGVAVYFDEEKITYRDLNDKADKLASYLTSKGHNNKLVGIVADRTPEIIIGILGILKSGNAYLPMDVEHPKERNVKILEESRTKVILTNISGLKMDKIEVVDLCNEKIYMQEYDNVFSKVKSSDLAYVIYTSGSTGVPKGVMVEHGNVVNFVYGMKGIVSIKENESLLSLTTISFDIFGLEMYVPLLSGTSMVLAGSKDQYEMQTLLDLIDKTNVRVLQLTPSRLKLMMSDPLSKEIFSKMDTLLIGGEEFPASLHKQATEEISCKIFNMYGPTETTIWSTYKDVTGDEILNIGKPIQNTQIYILGSKLELQATGVTGELYIAGAGVSRGYYKNETLTSERFIDNPYEKGTKLYRTGDLARWFPDGNIEFLGRIDHQVKIRGFRIELGEIENALLKHEKVKESVVIAREDDGDKYLCSYIVIKNEELIIINETDLRLREYLAGSLPEYMIPSYFVILESLPLTPNGKIDRKSLPKPEIKAGEDYTPADNETEEKLVAIWSEILNIPPEEISVTTSFFELGGHSLKATSIIASVYKEFGYEISMVEFFKKSAIRQVAQFILASDWVNNEDVLSDFEKEEIVL